LVSAFQKNNERYSTTPRAVEHIHATAIVDPCAQVSPSATIGPYAIVGPDVVLENRVVIGAHAVLEGHLVLEDDVQVSPFVCIGQPPQDQKCRGEGTGVHIGPRTIIREFTTINRGTLYDTRCTRVGADGLIMAYCHLAHDVVLGDRVVLSNHTTLAGHVKAEDEVTCGGNTAVHQHCRLGRGCFVAAGAMVERDVPPFCRVFGDRAKLVGPNLRGLRRIGLAESRIRAVKNAYKELFRTTSTLEDTLRVVTSKWPDSEEVRHLIEFIRASERGICR